MSRAQSPIIGLPADATNISFLLPGLLGPETRFEFDTSEQSFIRWVREHPIVQPSTQHPIRILRYTPGADQNHQITINNGYLYEWTEEDRGEHLAYDKDTGRAYYRSHTR
jgi:hypothetical protein